MVGNIPGGTPLYGLYRYVGLQRVWFFSCFCNKWGINFVNFSHKEDMVFAFLSLDMGMFFFFFNRPSTKALHKFCLTLV